MIRTAGKALLATIVLAVITGLIFPVVMTGVGLLMKGRSTGSLIERNGKVVGSSLVGQTWEGPQWFYGRPSATATPYDATASSGSNQGPLSQALADSIGERIKAISDLESKYHSGLTASQIPVDLLTASASGLDPHISPQAALFQAPRIAEVRDMTGAQVRKLIDEHTEGRTLGILGQPRVNVLELNLALAGT